MTGFALSWVMDDDTAAAQQQPPAPVKPRRACPAHVWSEHWRAGREPGKISNLFQRECKCGAVQIWRGSQYGTLRELVREY